jgi:hypothetical protein
MKNQWQLSSKCRSRTGGTVQVVEHLLCKHEALSSNFSPTQKNKIQNAEAVDRGQEEERYVLL